METVTEQFLYFCQVDKEFALVVLKTVLETGLTEDRVDGFSNCHVEFAEYMGGHRLHQCMFSEGNIQNLDSFILCIVAKFINFKTCPFLHRF